MAKRISKLPEKTVGRPRLYPWDRWMDGSAWRIERGTDFEVTADAMAGMIRDRARRLGLSARAYVDGDSVEFQFSREGKAAA